MVPFVLLICTTSLNGRAELTWLFYRCVSSEESTACAVPPLRLQTTLNRRDVAVLKSLKSQRHTRRRTRPRLSGPWRSRRLWVSCVKCERVSQSRRVRGYFRSSAADELRKPWRLHLWSWTLFFGKLTSKRGLFQKSSIHHSIASTISWQKKCSGCLFLTSFSQWRHLFKLWLTQPNYFTPSSITVHQVKGG